MSKKVCVFVSYRDSKEAGKQFYIENVAFKFGGNTIRKKILKGSRKKELFVFPNLAEAEGFATIISKVKQTYIEIRDKEKIRYSL